MRIAVYATWIAVCAASGGAVGYVAGHWPGALLIGATLGAFAAAGTVGRWRKPS